MSLEAALFSRLTAVAGVTALVSQRVYPVQLPQNPTLPAVTYEVLSERRLNTFRGPLGLPGTLMRVCSWGLTYAAAKDLARQVRLALDGWQGTSSGETVQASILERQQDLYEDEVQVHRVAAEYRFWWNES